MCDESKLYHGIPCGVCGGTERYKSNRRCRACNIRSSEERNAIRVVNQTKKLDEEQQARAVDLGNRILAMRW